MSEIKEKRQRPFKFKMGADPEFNIILQDKKIKAKEAIQKLMMRTTDQYSDNGKEVKGAGEFGWDGHPATGEIRPNPSKSPITLANNIGRLFQAWARITKMFKLSTLSQKGSVGGHIHIEVDGEEYYREKGADAKAKKLHKALSSFFLPIMMGENKVNLKARMNENYGNINDYRIKPLEGNSDVITYEFRVPSAEWTTTPKICKAVLAYVGTVYNEYKYNNANFMKYKDIIYKNAQQGRTLQSLALAEYKALTNGLVKSIQKAIKTFEYYEDYKEEIDYILKYDKVLEDKEKLKWDIMEGWNLTDKKQPTKKDLLSTKKLKEESKKMDLDAMFDLVSIPHNGDLNVDIFAREFKQRIIALNWKLKNSYYLYGLRQGIKEFIVVNRNNEIMEIDNKLIKTTSDLESLKELSTRMIRNFRQKLNLPEGTINERRKQILIGIPYNLRVEGNYKKLISLIYKIEKEESIIKKIKREDLENDEEKRVEERGKLWKIMNNVRRENISDVIGGIMVDEYDSQNQNNYNRAAQELSEGNEEENYEEENEICDNCGEPMNECECDDE